MDNIGRRLKEERQLRGWSQRDLARETKVNTDTISGIETGQHEPRPSTLRKLAEGLGIEVRDLFAEPARPLAEAPREAGLVELYGTPYPDPRSPQAKAWFREHGYTFAALSDDDEFVAYVVQGEHEDLEQEGRRATALRKDVLAEAGAMSNILVRKRPTVDGLFPPVPAGPDRWNRLMEAHDRIRDFGETLHNEVYSPQLFALVNYANGLETAIREGKTRADLLGEKLVEARAA